MKMVKIYQDELTKFSIGRYPPTSGKIKFKIESYLKTPMSIVLERLKKIDLKEIDLNEEQSIEEPGAKRKMVFDRRYKRLLFETSLYLDFPSKERIKKEGKKVIRSYYKLIQQIGDFKDLDNVNATYRLLARACNKLDLEFPRGLKLVY
jgi:hypothetical protein